MYHIHIIEITVNVVFQELVNWEVKVAYPVDPSE